MARDLLSLGISAPTNSVRVSGDTLPPDASRSLELAAQDSDFHTFATRAVELARILTGASGSAIAFREAEGTICRARSGQGAPRIGARVDATAGISKQCLDSGTALYCADTETDVRINPEAARGLGIRSVAVVPVRKNGEDGDICGILEVFSDRPGVFSERHLKTLHHLAVLVGTAGQPNGAKDLATTLQASPEIPADPTSPVAPAPESTKAGFAIHSHLPSAKFPVTPAAPPTTPSVVPEKPISADVVPQAESERPPSTQAAFSGSPFSKSPSLESAPAASTAATTDDVQVPPEVAAPKIAAKDASVSQSPNELALLPQTESPRSVFLSNLAIVFAKEPPRSRARTSVPQR